jgi:hypothetical protein
MLGDDAAAVDLHVGLGVAEPLGLQPYADAVLDAAPEGAGHHLLALGVVPCHHLSRSRSQACMQCTHDNDMRSFCIDHGEETGERPGLPTWSICGRGTGANGKCYDDCGGGECKRQERRRRRCPRRHRHYHFFSGSGSFSSCCCGELN